MMNLLDYRVREVDLVYDLEFVETGKKIEIDFNELKSVNMKRVEICQGQNVFAVMVIHTGGKLGVWREGDEKWTTLHDGRQRSNYEDIICHKGRFYAVDCTGFTVVVDPFTLTMVEITPQMYPWGSRICGRFKHLVQASGNLFLVEKILDLDHDDLGDSDDDDEIQYPVSVAVYKLNEDKHIWISVDKIGDFSFFIGEFGSRSFAVSTQEFCGCPKNTVYCTEDCFTGAKDDFPGCDVGIYDLEEDKVMALSAFPHGGSKIFWPPPSWLKEVPGISKN